MTVSGIFRDKVFGRKLALPALPIAFQNLMPALVTYACTCLDEAGKIPWVMLHYRRCKRVKNITR